MESQNPLNAESPSHRNQMFSIFVLFNPSLTLPLKNKGREQIIEYHVIAPLPLDLREGVGFVPGKMKEQNFLVEMGLTL